MASLNFPTLRIGDPIQEGSFQVFPLPSLFSGGAGSCLSPSRTANPGSNHHRGERGRSSTSPGCGKPQ